MSDIRLHIANVDFALDAETREARHELLASFLGAYTDGELPAETQLQIDAHLVGCTRCRKELQLHRDVRERLGSEPVPAASAALRDRITVGIRAAAAPVIVPAVNIEAPAGVGLAGWAKKYWFITAVLALAFAAVPVFAVRRTQRAAAPTATVVAVAVPLFNAVLGDYRRVMAGDLPGRARDLVAVRAAVPFAFEPLTNPALRLLAAWTTSVAGEPAAVLAYRWNDRVVLQYFVTEGLLFQSPAVRGSLARKRTVSASDGEQSLLVWAEAEYGSVLVGDLQPAEFAVLRTRDERR